MGEVSTIKIGIIGSDSFIATQFYNSFECKDYIKLFTIKSSGKVNENVQEDLFKIRKTDLIDLDVVINFAAIVHHPNLKDKVIYEKINTELPIYLAIQSRKAGVKQFIQMSSIAVYGRTNYIDENSSEVPSNIYGKSKLMADKALLLLQDNNFLVSIIRPPLVYGGGNAPGNMMKLIRLTLYGIPLPFKSIKNLRDFINVKNLVDVFNIVINNKINGIVIPTDKKPISSANIVNAINANSKSNKLIRLPKILLTIIKMLFPSLYNKVFGTLKVQCNLSDDVYKPKYSFEEGIKEMIAIFE